MSFFAGLAEGFQTGHRMKREKEEADRLAEYRKAEQEYRASRDEVMDTRYIEEREIERKRQATLDARYEDELKYSRGRYAVEDERYQSEQDWRRERTGVEDTRYEEERKWRESMEEKKFGLEERRVDISETGQEIQQTQFDKTFEYRNKRDEIGDDRWKQEQDRIREESAEDKERWMQEFDLKKSEADKAAERWKIKFGFDKEQALSAEEWREAMQEYQKTRDIITDDKWNQQFNYTKEQADQAQANYRERMGFDRSVQLTNQQRWEAEMEWRQERAAVADEQFQTQLEDKRMSTLIGAGLTPSGTSKKNPNTPQGIADSVVALKGRVKNAEGLTDEDKKYFDTLMKDPAAAHKVYTFLQEQAEDGNVINIEDVPSVIEIAGVSEGKSEEAYALLKSQGVDVSDPEAFFGALQTLKDYRPTTIVTDVTPDAFRGPQNLEDIKKQRDLFIDTSIPAAQAMLEKMDGPDRDKLSAALNDVTSSDTVVKSRATSVILQFVSSPEHIARLEKRGGAFKGLSKNEFLMPYMQEPAAEPETPIGQPSTLLVGKDGAAGPSVDSVSKSLNLPEGSDDVPSFNSIEDYNAWREEGNSGPVVVMGRKGNAAPIAPELDTLEPSMKGIFSGKTPGEKIGLGQAGREPAPETELDSLKQMVKDVEIENLNELKVVVDSYTQDKDKRKELFEALKLELGL